MFVVGNTTNCDDAVRAICKFVNGTHYLYFFIISFYLCFVFACLYHCVMK